MQIHYLIQMIVRDRLLAQMSSLATESKWEQTLTEIMNEMLEMRPSNPYLFLQKKTSLRQKMDNSKTSQYLIQLTLYLTHIDPLLTQAQIIKDKIISLCVQKFQHTKIKKTEIMQLVNVTLLNTETARRQLFVKVIDTMLDREIYTILEYADILYHAVLFRAVIAQIGKLEKRLSELKMQLTRVLFLQWLGSVNQQFSITKQLNLELEDVDIFKGIASQISARISL